MHCCRIMLDRSRNHEEQPCHRFLPVDIESDEIDVQILTCSMMDKGAGYSMIHVTDRSGSLEEGDYDYPGGSSTVTRISRNGYMAMVTNRCCMLSRLINRSGCFLSSAVPRSDTMIEWTIIGPSSAQVHGLLSDMRDNGYSLELISSTTVTEFATLSPKQQIYFNTAMDLGYYDVPKRIDLYELSRILGCSKSTLNVSLREAERKIFEFYRVMRFGSRTGKRSEHVRIIRYSPSCCT